MIILQPSMCLKILFITLVLSILMCVITFCEIMLRKVMLTLLCANPSTARRAQQLLPEPLEPGGPSPELSAEPTGATHPAPRYLSLLLLQLPLQPLLL